MKKLFTSFLVLGMAISVQAAETAAWKALSAGDNSTYGIKTDGTLWAWGDNEEGQLGVGSTAKFSTEPLQVGTESTWKDVYGARGAVFCIKEDGTLWTAGSNEKGMSGVGDGLTKHTTLVQVGTDNDWAEVYTSNSWCYTVLATKTDGTLWAWGDAESFTYGNGSIQNSAVPVCVNTDKDWKQIAVGTSHVLALKNDGTLYGWGFASYHQLLNDEVNVKTPTRVGTDTWDAVYAIDNASYAVKADGTLWAWGDNQLNILGFNDPLDDTNADGMLANVTTPRQVTAIEGKVTDLSGCSYVRVAIADGKAYAWGANANGALGNGKGEAYEVSNNQFSYIPVAVSLPEGTVSATISSGLRFTALLTNDAIAYGWGANRWGQLGNFVDDSNATFEPTPIVMGMPAPPKPGEYTVDASSIPSSLADAVKLTLIGEWGTSEFQKLCVAIGANLGFPPVGNKTLVSVDMSAATIKPNTSMYVAAGMQNAGAFKMCKALESVKFPQGETAANIVNLQECFQNCEKLTACDISGLTGVTNITDAFYNTAITTVNMAAWTATVTKSEDAFGKCTKLNSMILPANFTVGKYLFNSCSALRLIDWSLYADDAAPVIASDANVFQDLTAEEQALITVMVPAAVYDSFKAGATWQYVNLQAVQEVEEGTYRIEATNIPSDLRDAVKIYLSGRWDSDKFKALSDAIGNNNGTVGNNVLKLVDMSAAEVAVGSNLSGQFPGALWGTVTKGIFQACKALETVVMPAIDQAANLRSLQNAFSGCEALTELDLSGCTGANATTDLCYGCTSLTKVTLPGNFSFSDGTLDRCNTLSTIEWSLFEGNVAPAFKMNSIASRGKELSIIVPAEAYDSFVANTSWNAYNIVKAGTSGIDNIEATEPAVREVYTLSGMHVGTLQPGESATALPAGLYIIGGRKVLVK